MSKSSGKDTVTVPSGSNKKKLGIPGLTAIVVSAMVGGGVFNLPQNMSSGSAVGPVIIAWIVAAFGMWFITNTFRVLAEARPKLTDGIYMYAQDGFGNFAGFFVGFGYWFANSISLVAYSILLMDTLNFYIPYFKGGNNIWSVVVGSIILWIIFFVCLNGVKGASVLNLIGTIGKIVPIVIFLLIVIFSFRLSIFITNFWGHTPDLGLHDKNLGSIFSQSSSTMTVVMWLFLGIEGAVVVSGRAKNQDDVRKSTLLGYIIVLVLYAAVSILPYSHFSQGQLARMPEPSMGVILNKIVGDWGSIVVNIGIAISILSSWLTWLVMLGEIPYSAAKSGTFPKSFLKQNKKKANWVALLWTAIVAQVFIIVSSLATNAWTTFVNIVTVMAVPCYFFSSLYLFKIAIKKEYPKDIFASRVYAIITGIIGTIFTLYILYSGGVFYALLSIIFYGLGMFLYFYTRKRYYSKQKVFTKLEWVFVVILFVLLVIAIVYAVMKYL